MKKIYFIFRKIAPSEETQLLSELQAGNKIFFKEKQLVSESLIESTNSFQINSDPNFINRINSNHINVIKELGNEMVGTKTVAEHLKYKESTYWFYVKFSLFHRTSSYIQEIEELNQLIKENIADQYCIYSNKTETATYFHSIAKVFPSGNKEKQNNKFSYLFQYGVLFMLRVILGFIKLPFQVKTKTSHVILTNPYNLQTILDKSTGEPIIAEPHLSYLIEDSQKDDRFLLLSQIKAINLSKQAKVDFKNYFKFNKDSKRTLFLEPFLFLAILSPAFYQRRKEFKDIKKNFRQELSSASHNDKLKDLILSSLSSNLKMIIQAIWREEAALKLGYFQKIKTLTLIDEHSLKNRSLWYPLLKYETKVLAVQHGGISSGNLAYRFSENDRQYNPLPHLTLIRGEYTKEMLMNDSIFKENELKVVGHMRTDVIPTLIEKQKKNKSKRPQILYATQPILQSDKDMKLKQYHDFFKVCSELSHIDFIVKPHPNELDLDLYRNIAKQYNVTNYTIQVGDLYQLIAKSDIVITYYSTVGIEAIYFNKALITLDYNKLDLQGYIKDGVSHNVTNDTELKETILNILNKSLRIDKSNMQLFVKKRALSVDGKTTERHMNSILLY